MFHCRFCKNQCIKKGWQSYRQKLYCKSCRKYQQLTYCEHRVQAEHERMAVLLNNEGCSISSIGRITGFSKTTVCTIIARMGSTRALVSPVETGQDYEIDELKTFVRKKENDCWIIYSLNKTTKKVVSFFIGKRTKENIGKVIDELKKLNPKSIRTDGLNIYPGLIGKNLHMHRKKVTNHIERKNLHLRQQLRRLQRKTICFSKSEKMLHNSVALCMTT